MLKRREGYRKAFDGFDPAVVAQYDALKIEELMADAGIIRNRLKIKSAIANATAFQRIQADFGSFDTYLWKFMGDQPKLNPRVSMQDIPTTTPESDALSRDLKLRGFNFVGSTICQAFMQAVGMVDDHVAHCFRTTERKGETDRI